jgi:hypothetical protein
LTFIEDGGDAELSSSDKEFQETVYKKIQDTAKDFTDYIGLAKDVFRSGTVVITQLSSYFMTQ